jgi:hypothetical protein
MWGIAADALLLLHGAFIAWVLLGGLAVAFVPRLAWLHLPALAWGVYVQFTGTVCPLTPWENSLRLKAGEAGYAGGFIEHYLTAAIYPEGLTRQVQFWLGCGLLAINLGAYACAWQRRRDRVPTRPPRLR